MPSIGGQKSGSRGPVFEKISPISDEIGYHIFGFCGRRVGNGKAFVSGLEGESDSGKTGGAFHDPNFLFHQTSQKIHAMLFI